MSCALETRDAWRFVCIDVIALNPSVLPMSMGFFFCGGDESDEQHYIYDFMVCKVFPHDNVPHGPLGVTWCWCLFLPQAVSVCVCSWWLQGNERVQARVTLHLKHALYFSHQWKFDINSQFLGTPILCRKINYMQFSFSFFLLQMTCETGITEQ